MFRQKNDTGTISEESCMTADDSKVGLALHRHVSKTIGT